MSNERLQVKLLSADARLPTRGSDFRAGYNLYTAGDVTIAPRSSASIRLDIAVTVPPGTYGQLAGRSGFTRRNHATVEAGVIDIDYTGPLEVLMFNHMDAVLTVQKGERVAQLLLIRIANPEIHQVEELVKTVRGSGGFGSTGSA